MSASAAPACLSCGTCCFSLLETYARVEGMDYARLGERADELTVFIGNRCYMRMEHGHCAALRLDVENARFVCSVYELRPEICCALERGSPACQAEIHEKGERPKQLLARALPLAEPERKIRTRR